MYLAFVERERNMRKIIRKREKKKKNRREK